MAQDSIQETLERELAEHRETLTALEKRSQDLAVEVADLQATVRAYDALVSRRALRNGHHPPASAPLSADFQVVSPVVPRPHTMAFPSVGVGKSPGNRNPLMPKRTERFAAESISNAVMQLGNEWRTGKHPNDYSQAIWQITTRKELALVKRTLFSILHHLLQKGRLVRNQGLYGIPDVMSK